MSDEKQGRMGFMTVVEEGVQLSIYGEDSTTEVINSLFEFDKWHRKHKPSTTMGSSKMDFPDEYTSDPAVIKLVKVIKQMRCK